MTCPYNAGLILRPLLLGLLLSLETGTLLGGPGSALDPANNRNCQISGWAELADPTQAATVGFYLDGPAGTGTAMGTTAANLKRTDLPSNDANHGFLYRFTNLPGNSAALALYSNTNHAVYAYVLTTPPLQIGSGPLTFQCGTNAGVFISQSVPSNMVVGGTYPVSMTFQNTGSRTWLQYPTDGFHRLGSEVPNDTTQWGPDRVELPQDVPPGAMVTIQFKVQPQATGQVTFQWRVLEEIVANLAHSAPVAVTVGPGKSMVSVRDYGATGDGMTDDSDAIQAAINDTAPGGSVFVPAGTYIIATSHYDAPRNLGSTPCGLPSNAPGKNGLLLNKPGLTFTGEGRDSVLMLGPNAGMAIVFVAAPNVTVQKLVFDGNGAKRLRIDPNTGQPFSWPCGLVVGALVVGYGPSVGNDTFQDIESRNGIEDGMGMDAPNFTVRRVYTHDNGGFGVSHAYGESAGGAAISLSGGANQTVIDNIAVGNTQGIVVGFGSVGVDIKYNVLLGHYDMGLELGGGPSSSPPSQPDSSFAVDHNWVEGNGVSGSTGVQMDGGQNGIFSSNFVLNNVNPAISLGDRGAPWPVSSGWQILNNVIEFNPQYAVRVKNRSTGIVIKGNQLLNNGNGVNPPQVVVDASAAGSVNADWPSANTVTNSTPPAKPPTPAITSAGIANAASGISGPVSPGEILVIYGSNLGPSQLVSATSNSDGRFERILSNTRVLFDGVPGVILYTSGTQVSVIAPYYLYWKDSTAIQVEYNQVRSNTVTMPLVVATPALFTANQSGKGQGAVLNQDYSVNSPANPTARGSIVMLYATGFGQTDPGGADGLLASAPLPAPRLPVTVTIGGVPATLLYAGAAPGLVAGVTQINVAVPSNAPTGATVPVQISSGSILGSAGVTIAIQ